MNIFLGAAENAGGAKILNSHNTQAALVSENPYHFLQDFIWMHIDGFLTLGLFVFMAVIFAVGGYFYKIEQAKEEVKKRNFIANKERMVLESLSQIYLTMHVVELFSDRMYDFIVYNNVKQWMHRGKNATKMMKDVMENAVILEQVEEAKRFVDLSNVAERIGSRTIISKEFIGVYVGWFRAQFIVVKRDEKGMANIVVFATQVIDEEKKHEEALIRISKTDEMTQLYNRRAYEEALFTEEENKESGEGKDLIILSVDINGLKVVNDTQGHAAGDELIIGASKCMVSAFANLGKLYRIGGDEFIVLLHTDKKTLKTLLLNYDRLTAEWKGTKVEQLSTSYGYAARADYPKLSVEQLAVEADKWMYTAKAEHYSVTGQDRRGTGGGSYFSVSDEERESEQNE